MATRPTLVMIPCFAGAPWELERLTHLSDWPMCTPRLPDDLDDIEEVANFVLTVVQDLNSYVLVGDSYGAVVSIAVAIRRPPALKGLVISGGFARNPITSPVLKTLAALAPYFPGPFYRHMTLRAHANNLRSVYDAEGEVPWSRERTREFFLRETPHNAYINRVRSIERADYVSRLPRIDVPTLILTPAEDRLIGKDASRILLEGIRNSEEVVMPRTGHMFRFSHPSAYSLEVQRFLERRVDSSGDKHAGDCVGDSGHSQVNPDERPATGRPADSNSLTRAVLRNLVLAAAAAGSTGAANANNGYLLPGYGVRANGMGGVGIALPQDSIAAAINPAGIGFVRDRLDVELAWNRLSRGASVSGSAAPINRDYDGNGRSNFVVPTMGYSYTVGPEMTLGVSIVGSGLNASYKTAIPLFGTSKASVDLRQVFISPSIAYKIAPEHALGIAVNLVQQSLKVEGLEYFAGNSQLSMSPGNVTNRGYDSSYGLGLRLGYTGIITPWLTVGATYQPRIAMGRFDKYEGLIARRGELDIPTNYGVGVSVKPNLETTVALDINRIAYSGIPSIGNPLSRLTVDGNTLGSDSGPGFGWRDMTIYKVGIDYAVTPKWTLRAGYNYGKQPIPQSQTFFNILAPVTTESYYTVGTTWNPGNSWEISAYYMYAPENKVRGNGSIPPAFGGGEADIRLKQQALGVSLSWKY